MLSYSDLTNSNYGFSTSYDVYDIARRSKTTDYAKAQGCWNQSAPSPYEGNGYYWLRSSDNESNMMIGVCRFGYVGDFDYSVNLTRHGVRPALYISLK